MSKLVTSVAVMQAVEKGSIDLDDDVRGAIEELKDLRVLSAFENEEPVLEDIQGKLTVR